MLPVCKDIVELRGCQPSQTVAGLTGLLQVVLDFPGLASRVVVPTHRPLVTVDGGVAVRQLVYRKGTYWGPVVHPVVAGSGQGSAESQHLEWTRQSVWCPQAVGRRQWYF